MQHSGDTNGVVASTRAIAHQRQRHLHRYFEASCDAAPDAIALEGESEWLTYRQLDERANQLAHLVADRVRPGERVGVLLHRSTGTYVVLLALQKAGATFVPIDPVAPAERVAYISEDAGLALLLSSSDVSFATQKTGCRVLELDTMAGELEQAPVERPEVAEESDSTCCVMCTSGSSGRPKGVEVAQSSICNFIEVVRERYRVSPIYRVYQGMSISFDFSIEEIWPTWAVGATLVAGPSDDRSLGDGLARFLTERDVMMLYCVPTVLASIQAGLPGIHTLVMGGEACPAELVERWSPPGRRMLNTYGPTEAEVINELPLMASGKVDRPTLPTPTRGWSTATPHTCPRPRRCSHLRRSPRAVGRPGVRHHPARPGRDGPRPPRRIACCGITRAPVASSVRTVTASVRGNGSWQLAKPKNVDPRARIMILK